MRKRECNVDKIILRLGHYQRLTYKDLSLGLYRRTLDKVSYNKKRKLAYTLRMMQLTGLIEYKTTNAEVKLYFLTAKGLNRYLILKKDEQEQVSFLNKLLPITEIISKE